MRAEPARLVEIDIDDLSHDGRGVGRVDGKVWFVDGALPGERALVRPVRGKRSHALGVLDQLLKPSPERVAPRCPVFGVCGGCVLQHLEHAAQLRFKSDLVVETFAKAGVSELPAINLISRPPWGYRRRARLGVRDVAKKGGILVGFRERNKSYVTPISSCDVLAPSVAQFLPGLTSLISELSIRDRVPQVEVAVGDQDTALVFRNLKAFSEADSNLLKTFAQSNGVQVFMQPQGPDSIVPVWPHEPRALFYELPDFSLKICFSPTSFVQVNGAINEALVSTAIDWLALDPGDTLLDLFCGLGNFSLAGARQAGGVVGIEGEMALVDQARSNAELNGIFNARFIKHDLFLDNGPAWGVSGATKVLVDPPRSGAIEALKVVCREVKPSRIVYVSCNPATLARDAQFLVGTGAYRISQVSVVDMFPHTAHVETAALFEKVS